MAPVNTCELSASKEEAIGRYGWIYGGNELSTITLRYCRDSRVRIACPGEGMDRYDQLRKDRRSFATPRKYQFD
jgi:hypothetical protein